MIRTQQLMQLFATCCTECCF